MPNETTTTTKQQQNKKKIHRKFHIEKAKWMQLYLASGSIVHNRNVIGGCSVAAESIAIHCKMHPIDHRTLLHWAHTSE